MNKLPQFIEDFKKDSEYTAESCIINFENCLLTLIHLSDIFLLMLSNDLDGGLVNSVW